MKLYYIVTAAYLFFAAIGFVQIQMSGRNATTGVTTTPPAEGSSLVWNNKEEGKRLFKWSLLALLIAVAGLFPLMGMPGLLVVGFYEITGILRGKIKGDSMWPAAIINTLLWPLGIPIGILLQQLGKGGGLELLAVYGLGLGIISWIVIAGFLQKAKSF